MTALAERGLGYIEYEPVALLPCTDYEITVAVSDIAGNPSGDTRWVFVTECL